MSTAPTAVVNSESSGQTSSEKVLDDILGVAIFDLNGLPREYFVTPENDSTNWVQIVFQSLGLKSLLMSSLKLESFQHISIYLNQQTAIVVRTKNAYVALLLKGKRHFPTTEVAERFSQWVRHFEQHTLRQNPRFKPA
ncbi:MAG TPA: hypothetical protein V6D29_12505 [Leptolyngbyaceae cyanobacterium]